LQEGGERKKAKRAIGSGGLTWAHRRGGFTPPGFLRRSWALKIERREAAWSPRRRAVREIHRGKACRPLCLWDELVMEITACIIEVSICL
jgi:hypothetical protein